MTAPLTICYFGDYDPAYSRTKVLMKGLREHGVTLIECRIDPNEPHPYQALRALYKTLPPHDAVIVGFSHRRSMVLYARLLAGRRPVFLDVLFSFYDSWVYDRKIVQPRSLKAAYHWLRDWAACMVASRVFLDTKENIDYFVRTYRVPRAKFDRVFLGADTDIFMPQQKQSSKRFIVEYHGKYIPLHGVDTLMHAARLVSDDPDIQFRLIGNGQEYGRVHALAHNLRLTNVTFIPPMPAAALPEEIREADVCIGLIGDVPRVEGGIANKLFEAAAMARVSINADTRAAREIFTDGKDVILIPRGNAEALAQAIRALKGDPAHRAQLGANARETFLDRATPAKVGEQMIAAIARAKKGA